MGAAKIEIEMLKRPIGKQDHYAAFGGINKFKFNSDESVNIKSINKEFSHMKLLFNPLLIFYTNQKRNAAKILSHQNKRPWQTKQSNFD